ncbi:MAG: nicotinate-nucleotide--dimethylbenzimidazole phosphoribosyltransferase [Parvularculales bacterium]
MVLSFEDVRAMAVELSRADERAATAARERQLQLVKPPGALGRLEDIAVWLASWREQEQPMPVRPALVVCAGNHGITCHGISAWPIEVTAQMVETFRNGGAAVNQLAQGVEARLEVVDLTSWGLTGDITQEAAMDEAGCVAAMRAGMEAVPNDCDLLGLGDMGIGNTTIAAALCCALFGGQAQEWVGPGAGSDEAGIERKCAVVSRALTHHADLLDDPLEILRRLGGWEEAALVGAILEARLRRIPTLLDGYVVSAAAGVLHELVSGALDHCLAAHCSAEPAHRRLLEVLDKAPLLDLEMRLGEASGAALGLGLVRAAAAVHKGMITFDEATIDGGS